MSVYLSCYHNAFHTNIRHFTINYNCICNWKHHFLWNSCFSPDSAVINRDHACLQENHLERTMFTNTFTYWCIGRNPGRFTQCFSEVTPDKFTYLAMRTENNEMSGGLLTYKNISNPTSTHLVSSLLTSPN